MQKENEKKLESFRVSKNCFRVSKVCLFLYFTWYWGLPVGSHFLNYVSFPMFSHLLREKEYSALNVVLLNSFSLGPTSDSSHSPKILTRKSTKKWQAPDSLPFTIPRVTFKILVLHCSSPPIPGKLGSNSFEEKQMWF